MNNEFDAILWDFDGVIVDSERLWMHQAPEFYAQQVGRKIDPVAQQKFVGGSLFRAWEILSRDYGLTSSFEQFDRECIEFAVTQMYPHCSLLSDIVSCFQFFQKNNISQAIGSSGHIDWVGPTSQRLKIDQYFDEVVTAEDVGNKGKPAPDIFLRCAELLEVDVTKCLVIEDSMNGCVAGKAAGATVWGLRNGWNQAQDLSMADWEFSSFEEMLRRVNNL